MKKQPAGHQRGNGAQERRQEQEQQGDTDPKPLHQRQISRPQLRTHGTRNTEHDFPVCRQHSPNLRESSCSHSIIAELILFFNHNMTSSSFPTAKPHKPVFESLHRSVGLRGKLITGFKVSRVRDRELFVSLHETEAELSASSSAGFAMDFARLCSGRSSKLGPMGRSGDGRT